MDSPHSLGLGTSVQQLASHLATETAAVLGSINSAVVDVVGVACVTFLLVGVLLYFSHIGRRIGKDLIVGGVVLVVLTEYVIAAVAAFK